MRTAHILIMVTALLSIISTAAVAEIRIMDQRVSYCESGEPATGEVEQGKRVEVSMTLLVSEEKDLSLFSDLTAPVFYLEEDRVSENSTVMLTLQPGTHKIRVIGIVPIGPDGEKLTLLGSYDLGKYITSTIRSPYILKSSAYAYILLSGAFCALATGVAVFLILKGKLHRAKSLTEKSYREDSRKIRQKIEEYLRKIAPNLTATQRRDAKALLKEVGEILKWQ